MNGGLPGSPRDLVFGNLDIDKAGVFKHLYVLHFTDARVDTGCVEGLGEELVILRSAVSWVTVLSSVWRVSREWSIEVISP